MANLPTRILRRLAQRNGAMLCGELEEFFQVKRPGAVHHALESLKIAGCVAWTTTGWQITPAGRNYLKVNAKLRFEHPRASA
jgi:hypothetical protein